MEQEVISGALLKKRIKLKLPEVLPRAMHPADVKKLLAVEGDVHAERAGHVLHESLLLNPPHPVLALVAIGTIWTCLKKAIIIAIR
jgi:hypothetical protein